MKEKLKNLLAEGKLKEVLEQMKKAKDTQNRYFEDSVIGLSARFSVNERSKHSNVIALGDYQKEYNKIVIAVQELLDSEFDEKKAVANSKIHQEESAKPDIAPLTPDTNNIPNKAWNIVGVSAFAGLAIVVTTFLNAAPTKKKSVEAETASVQGGTFKKESIEPEMVSVQGGTFQMGSNDSEADNNEKPVHTVTVNSFSIGKYEVTQAQWRAVMGNNPSYFKNCDNCPVEQVSWDDIQQFLSKLNSLTGKRYRLPTEAEWEYAARGYNYIGSNDLNNVAWYEGNSGSKTHPVGVKSANELGIYDMSGNVWEWCQDWYDSSYYSSSPQSNPIGAAMSSHRVRRGGSWDNGALICRASLRYNYAPAYRHGTLGFRVVVSLQ